MDEEPTVLDPKEAALITNGDELQLLLPLHAADEPMPEAALFLAACLLRSEDEPEFWRAQIDWLAEKMGEAGFDVTRIQ